MIYCFLPRLLCWVNSCLQTVHVIWLPAKSLGRKQNHTDSLCRKPFFVDGSLRRKQEFTDSLGGSKCDRQSLQEAKISGLVYTLRFSTCIVWALAITMLSHLSLQGRVAQSVGHLTRKSEVLGSIPGLATYFRFSFH